MSRNTGASIIRVSKRCDGPFNHAFLVTLVMLNAVAWLTQRNAFYPAEQRMGSTALMISAFRRKYGLLEGSPFARKGRASGMPFLCLLRKISGYIQHIQKGMRRWGDEAIHFPLICGLNENSNISKKRNLAAYLLIEQKNFPLPCNSPGFAVIF